MLSSRQKALPQEVQGLCGALRIACSQHSRRLGRGVRRCHIALDERHPGEIEMPGAPKGITAQYAAQASRGSLSATAR